MLVRPTIGADIPALQALLRSIVLFPAEMLPDMIAPYLAGADDGDFWLTCEAAGRALGFCLARAEEMTDGTWNMLALGVAADAQARGLGKALVAHLEGALAARGARLLLVDTSGTDAFAPARAFYAGLGYAEEARIREYWAAGDDKVTFCKALA